MAYVVAARWTARPGEEAAVASALSKLAPLSRLEAGNLVYTAHRDPENSRVFFFYEQYADKAAYEAHTTSAHFEQHGLGDAIPRLESREREFYETWDV